MHRLTDDLSRLNVLDRFYLMTIFISLPTQSGCDGPIVDLMCEHT